MVSNYLSIIVVGYQYIFLLEITYFDMFLILVQWDLQHAFVIHIIFQLTIQGAPVTILNVVLKCDHSVTPWCDCTESIGNTPRDPHQPGKSQDVIVPRLNRKKHLTQDG